VCRVEPKPQPPRRRCRPCADTREFQTIWVPIAEIRISERRRRTISRSTVERYRLWLDVGHDPPPVRLARHGDAYLVRDGRHRIAAALAAGHTFVEAELERIVGSLGRRFARRSSSVRRRRTTWGRSSAGGATRLHREGAGSTPAVSTQFHGAAACVSAIAPARVPGSCSRENPIERREDEGSNPSGSTPASVVSTASTRPLYGRGAGSTPAGGSLRS
jgi:hypothetical protein